MTKKQNASPIESVKASLRRKALDAQMQRGITPKEKTTRKAVVKPEVPKEMFDPSEFGGGWDGKHVLQLGELPKGEQPPWVKEQYGSNAEK